MFGIKNILIELNFERTAAFIERLEKTVVKALDWRLNLTTPIELTKLLLYYSNSSFDFREICSHVNNFIYLCLIGNTHY